MTNPPLIPDPSKWERTVGATTFFIFNVFLQLRAIEDSSFNERVLSVEELVASIQDDLPEDAVKREAVVAFARTNLAQLYDAQSRAARGEYVASPNVAFADIASAYVDDPLGGHLSSVVAVIESVLSPLRDSEEGLRAYQGVIFRIQALTQPTFELLRAGILAVAVGQFEQHLLQLKSIDEDRPSAIPEGESRVSELLKYMTSRYSPVLNWQNEHIPEVKQVIEERNALIHREGRVDARFIRALSDTDIEETSHGLLLDVSVRAMKHRIAVLLGFGLRASICVLTQQDAPDAKRSALEGHRALLDYLGLGLGLGLGLAGRHLSDLD